MAISYGAGRAAVTRFRVLERFIDFTLLELELESGRTHQVRLHMAHAGYPVLGDRLYGEQDRRIGRQALHAACLAFQHPVSKKLMEFRSELPEDMRKVVEEGRGEVGKK